MQLGRIIGNVVCTMKNASLEGHKLLLVGAVGPYLLSLFQGDAVEFIIG